MKVPLLLLCAFLLVGALRATGDDHEDHGGPPASSDADHKGLCKLNARRIDGYRLSGYYDQGWDDHYGDDHDDYGFQEEDDGDHDDDHDDGHQDGDHDGHGHGHHTTKKHSKKHSKNHSSKKHHTSHKHRWSKKHKCLKHKHKGDHHKYLKCCWKYGVCEKKPSCRRGHKYYSGYCYPPCPVDHHHGRFYKGARYCYRTCPWGSFCRNGGRDFCARLDSGRPCSYFYDHYDKCPWCY